MWQRSMTLAKENNENSSQKESAMARIKKDGISVSIQHIVPNPLGKLVSYKG
jgi:hypothetical protein